MSTRTRLLRFLAGLGVLLLTLVVAFGLALATVPRWGATTEELALVLPGDELAPEPLLNWTNAVNINAPPDAVWPWIAQMGDTRGGFYSYTFIEDRVGAITGAPGYDVDYQNANRIVPEWQHPAAGDELIQGMLRVRAAEPGQYLLADAIDPSVMQWVWLWHVSPLAGGEQSRLVVRFRIQLASAGDNPLMTGALSAGGFVMQQRMMHGLKTRAEGGVEPAYSEAVEVALWLTTLATAVAGAVLFLAQREWQRPLALAVVSLVVLVAFTFIQPAIWLRVLVNALLLAGVWWAYRPRAKGTVQFRARAAARQEVWR